ncbi:MAG: ABC transporter permease [Elioraea sp.]|nr:ABC transporter permease [Elioraea sp.]
MTAKAPDLLVFDAASPQPVRRAVADLADGVRQWRLAWRLAVLDLRNRYRGSVIGPLWLTVSHAVAVVGLGLLYPVLMGVEAARYVPHLAAGFLVWALLQPGLAEGCQTFIAAESIIRQMRLPYSVHVLRVVFRTLLVSAHAAPVLVVVLVAYGVLPGAAILLLPLGLALVAVTLAAAALFLGMLCARFRDVAQIVGTVTHFAFFFTPILWQAEQLGPWQTFLLLNPFYPLLECVRAPLLGAVPALTVWAAAVSYAALAAGLAFALFASLRRRIAFWV